MKNLKHLLQKITSLTTEIETNYPELYTFLDENPITIPSAIHPDMDRKILEDYFEDLHELLKHHLETHKAKAR